MVVDQDRVRDLFNYDLETGIVTQKIRTSKRVKIGDVVGSRSHGYLRVTIDSRQYKLHRIIWLWMTGRWPDPEIDHKNHIKSDNWWSNLREVTHKENHKNQKLPKNNTSGVCGVSWVKRDEKWQALIMVNGKDKHLGYFDKQEDAVAAREIAEAKYGFHQNHGEAA